MKYHEERLRRLQRLCADLDQQISASQELHARLEQVHKEAGELARAVRREITRQGRTEKK